jgi:hypothetical protein
LLIGIGLFGDDLQTAGARGPLESISLIVLFGGVYFLARSPLVATVRSEDEETAHITRGLRRHHSSAGLLGATDSAMLAEERNARLAGGTIPGTVPAQPDAGLATGKGSDAPCGAGGVTQ